MKTKKPLVTSIIFKALNIPKATKTYKHVYKMHKDIKSFDVYINGIQQCRLTKKDFAKGFTRIKFDPTGKLLTSLKIKNISIKPPNKPPALNKLRG